MQPLVAFATFYRDGVKAFETTELSCVWNVGDPESTRKKRASDTPGGTRLSFQLVATPSPRGV